MKHFAIRGKGGRRAADGEIGFPLVPPNPSLRCSGASEHPPSTFFRVPVVEAPGRRRALAGDIVMEVLYPNCAGLDVHKDTWSPAHGAWPGTKVEREVRTFRNDDQWSSRPVGMAELARCHTYRHGSNRRLLAAGVWNIHCWRLLHLQTTPY